VIKRTLPSLLVIMILGLILAACGGAPPAAQPTQPAEPAAAQPTDAPAATEAATAAPAASEAASEAPAATEAPAEPTAAPSPTPVAVNTFDEQAAAGRTVIRWFVGLGAGGQPAQIEAQQAAVDQFNQSQQEIYLALEIVQNETAYDALATQIAAGNAPDIIGPVGVKGLGSFDGQWLDLSEQIAKNNLDLSEYDPALIDFYNFEGQGQIGLPFGVFPSFVYYNKDLFDEAGLAYPPQSFGEQYEGQEWTMDALRELGLKLTVDENGNDASMAEFDPEAIVQFGFVPQWGDDPRAVGTMFGAASMNQEGSAVVPENWVAGWQWWYDGMFKDHFIPNQAYLDSELLGGNAFSSGNVAMGYSHLWYTCCIDTENVQNWDIAVMPSYNGAVTAKLHGDTFSILNTTKSPDAAFTVLQYLLNNTELLNVYGAFPAKQSLQGGFFSSLDEKFAPNKVNWQVAVDSLAYADNPNHEAGLPNFLKSQDAITAFGTLLRSQGDLDVAAEAAKLQSELQAIYDEK
jgi:multiple sugar transport system substrate-binding protein